MSFQDPDQDPCHEARFYTVEDHPIHGLPGLHLVSGCVWAHARVCVLWKQCVRDEILTRSLHHTWSHVSKQGEHQWEHQWEEKNPEKAAALELPSIDCQKLNEDVSSGLARALR